MYDRILLPTDGSIGMLNAITHCFHQARLNDAAVHALYVVDLRAYVMLPDEHQDRVKQVLIEEGTAALEHLEDRTGEEIDIETEIREGVPHEEILEYAEENDIDLVVMGTHGRTGEKKRIVGSVAEEVVRAAEMPVLTARVTETEIEELDEEIPEAQRRYIT